MNRNVESHFSTLPSANISRSRFDRSQDIKFTCDAAGVIPFFVDEVLPGDTFDITSSKVIRMQTLLTPIFDNVYADIYWFFVPNRLTWKHWRELMGENTQSAWIPEVQYSVPQINFKETAVETGDILDYMGVPIGVKSHSTEPYVYDHLFSVSALPWRAYWLTMNEFFRSENLTDPVNIQDGDADLDYADISSDLRKPFKAAKFFDVFTSCLPSPQKGPPVSVPAGFNVDIGPGWPVTTPSVTGSNFENLKTNAYPLSWRKSAGAGSEAGDPIASPYTSFGNVRNSADDGATQSFVRAATNSTTAGIYPSNLFAIPGNNQNTGLSVNVNDLRYAFQLQKLYERDARGGTRYCELLASHFSVSNPDARLQRPEYLGGNRIGISIHQIANQSQGENAFLGDLGAMSLTTDKHHDFVKSFTEHGVLLGLMCIRYDHSYPQGLEKFWTRKNRFDYYWPVFASLGEEPVRKSELMATGDSSDDEVFGYQERWYDYRYKPNRVAGEMRPGIPNTLDSWHLADYYTEQPTLSDGWIREDPTTIDRVLAVTSANANQFLCDIYVKNFTTRPMPLYSIPGLIDHH